MPPTRICFNSASRVKRPMPPLPLYVLIVFSDSSQLIDWTTAKLKSNFPNMHTAATVRALVLRISPERSSEGNHTKHHWVDTVVSSFWLTLALVWKDVSDEDWKLHLARSSLLAPPRGRVKQEQRGDLGKAFSSDPKPVPMPGHQRASNSFHLSQPMSVSSSELSPRMVGRI